MAKDDDIKKGQGEGEDEDRISSILTLMKIS